MDIKGGLSALGQAFQMILQAPGNVKNFFDTGPNLPFKYPIPKRDVLTRTLPAGYKSPIPQSQIIPHPIGPSAFQQALGNVQQNTGEWGQKFGFGTNQQLPQSVVRESTPINNPSTPILTEEQYYKQQKATYPNADPRKIIMDYRQKIVPTPTPTTQPSVLTPTTFQFQDAINQAAQQTGLNLNQFHLLRSGENMAEKPDAIHYNSNGTIDVGLFQINVDPRNKAEVERLKNPTYNATRVAQIYTQRMRILGDPVLALASYNLGAGGAILRPIDALERAAWVYWKAGMQMPETEFTKDPLGYVRSRMDYYKRLGLFKP